MNNTEEVLQVKVARLPQWAQSHITNLERKLREADDHIREISEPLSIPETDTVIQQYARPNIKLPKGSTIEFTIGEHRLHVRAADDHVEVQSYSGGVFVHPRASNSVQIFVSNL